MSHLRPRMLVIHPGKLSKLIVLLILETFTSFISFQGCLQATSGLGMRLALVLFLDCSQIRLHPWSVCPDNRVSLAGSDPHHNSQKVH